jgi:adenosylmethionine-8-amino-7-oxononanoate aminotransferase
VGWFAGDTPDERGPLPERRNRGGQFGGELEGSGGYRYAMEGEFMTLAEHAAPTGPTGLAGKAADHLWMHFTRMGRFTQHPVPIITRGEGAYIYDDRGRRILDGLSALFVVQVGHGRRELAEVAAKQAEQLAYFPIWGYAHPHAIELAERLADAAPGDLNRVFFTTGGGEAVESAWKVAKQYFKLIGKPLKHKVISRATAYHGTPQGALAITGLPAMKQDFEPLTPGGFRVPNTNIYRAAPEFVDDPKAFGRWAADRVEEAILFEGPDTVAAVVLEPVQNSGGCLVAPPGYFDRVREICDRHDVLLVSDEVICAFGRHGSTFACQKFGYQPDIITCAKGMTSGYSPIGAMITTDRVIEPFLAEKTMFPHGYTFAGHPVSAAVALANLDIMDREGLNQRVLSQQEAFRSTLSKLYDLPIVGDVRGDGYFWAIELVTDKDTKQGLDADQRERLVRGFLPGALFDNGLYCRPDDRGDAVVQLAPPLICGQAEFDEMEQILRQVLTEAWAKL